jgi:hypothetical protein
MLRVVAANICQATGRRAQKRHDTYEQQAVNCLSTSYRDISKTPYTPHQCIGKLVMSIPNIFWAVQQGNEAILNID